MIRKLLSFVIVVNILFFTISDVKIFAAETNNVHYYFEENFDALSVGNINELSGWDFCTPKNFVSIEEENGEKYLKMSEETFSGIYEIKRNVSANLNTSINGCVVLSARVVMPECAVHIMLRDGDEILCDLGIGGTSIWLQSHYLDASNYVSATAKNVVHTGEWCYINLYIDLYNKKVSFAHGKTKENMKLYQNDAGEYKFNYYSYNYAKPATEKVTEVSFYAWNNGQQGRTWYGIDDVKMYCGGMGDDVITNPSISEDGEDLKLSYRLNSEKDCEIGSNYRVIGADNADFNESSLLKSGYTTENCATYSRKWTEQEKYIKFEIMPHTKLQTGAVKYVSETIENVSLSFERSEDGKSVCMQADAGVLVIAHKDSKGNIKNIITGGTPEKDGLLKTSLPISDAEYSDIFCGYVFEGFESLKPLAPSKAITISKIYDNIINKNNFALGKSVVVEEYAENGERIISEKAPDAVTDGDAATIYNSDTTATAGKLILDLGNDIKPYQLIKFSYNNIKDYCLYVSYDGTEWELIYEGREVCHGTDQFEIENKAYRYIKIDITDCYEGTWVTSGRKYRGFNIAELQVYDEKIAPEENGEWIPEIYKDFVNDKVKSNLPDVSYAGYHYGEEEIPDVEIVANVLDFGAKPNSGLDAKDAIQAAIDYAATVGGGAILIPKGVYDFNVDGTDKSMLEIYADNIVLRGEGSGTDGTVFRLNNMVLNETAWHTVGVVNFGNSVDFEASFARCSDVTTILEDIHKGDKTVKLRNTDKIKKGDIIQFKQYNNENHELTDFQFSPLEIPPEFTNAYKDKDGSTGYLWNVEVKRVIDKNTVELCQPARCDMYMKYRTDVFRYNYIKEAGVENIRFESEYSDVYGHHVSDEADYGWNAVTMTAVSHGWVRNVVVDNFTSAFIGSHNRNITVQNMDIYGRGGHNGVRHQASSHDCLVQNVNIYDSRTHAVGFDGYGQGNVARYIYCHVNGSSFDFHGGAAQQNLYENLYNASYLDGAGASENLPHSGHYNVLWNWSMPLSTEGHWANGFGSYSNEAIHSYFYKRGTPRFDHYMLYPKLIVVGLHSNNPHRRVEVGRTTEDRDTEEIYVEGLNRKNIAVESLYNAQRELRFARKEYVMDTVNN